MSLPQKVYFSILNNTPEYLSRSLPTLTLVGRTNVGKSTLFNCLTRSQAALTGDLAGITRDRRYGLCDTHTQSPFIVVDTAGINHTNESLDTSIQYQTQQALEKTNMIAMVTDARVGLTKQDIEIANNLRIWNKPILLVVNKSEKTAQHTEIQAEFAQLGFKHTHLISALAKDGISILISTIIQLFSSLKIKSQIAEHNPSALEDVIKIALIGRPNAGKSTLINQITGEQRAIVSDQLGTTRESIPINITYQGKPYILIDTPGIRRSAKINSTLEAASIQHSWHSVKASHVVLILIDATLDITDQDLRLLQLISERGKALIILVNKSDTIAAEEKLRFQKRLKYRLRFLSFFKIHYISALKGQGIKQLFALVEEAYRQGTQQLSTSQLTRLLQQALQKHSPPVTNNKKIKLRYAHPGGYNPIIIIIHGSQTQYISKDYRRYLENFYRHNLSLSSTPVCIRFKEKNKLD